MKKSLYFPLLLMTVIGATFLSACSDEDDSKTGTISQATYDAILDSICGEEQFLDTSYVASHNLLFCSKFEKDGHVYELVYHDTVLSVSKGVEATIDTIRMTWQLDRVPLGTDDGKTYYNMSLHYSQADNNGPFHYLESVSLESGAQDQDGRLIASVDGQGAVELYLVNDTAATRSVALVDFIADIGAKLWKKIITTDDTELSGRTDLDDWMKNIQDTIPVCRMSIPGTHDSFTYMCKLSKLWGRTQTYTIAEQWQRGVRCFDVRLMHRLDNILQPIPYPAFKDSLDAFSVTHGGLIDLNIGVAEAIKEIYKYVDQFKSETAIVVLKFDSEESAEDIQVLDNYISSLVKKDTVVQWTPGLTMGQARHKIIVVARYMSNIKSGVPKAFKKNEPDCSTSIGENILWGTNRGDNYLVDGVLGDNFAKLEQAGRVAKLFVQDKYEQDSDQKPTAFWTQKEQLMRACFDSINKPAYANQYVWAFNHTSGYIAPIIGGGISFKNMAEMNYPQNAWKMNPAMESLLKNDYKESYTGIVVMDFAGLTKNVPGGTVGAPFNVNCQTLPETIITHNNALSWKGFPFSLNGIN